MFDPQLVQDPRLKSLLSWWIAAGRGAPPPRSVATPEALAAWLDHVAVADRADGDWRYRRYGQGFAREFAGGPLDGRLNALPPEQRAVLTAEYDRIAQSGEAAARRHTALFPAPDSYGAGAPPRAMTWERLALPLAADATGPAAILVAAYPVEDESWSADTP